MCNSECFLVLFTIRAGAGFMSAIFLFLGLLGCLLVSLLPYSANEIQLILISLYMILLAAGFGLSLAGILIYNRAALRCGFLLSVLALVYWLLLTVPTLVHFSLNLDSNFCFAAQCGESHWLVPRHWLDHEFYDVPPPKEDIYYDDYFNLTKMPPFPDYQISDPRARTETYSLLRRPNEGSQELENSKRRSKDPNQYRSRNLNTGPKSPYSFQHEKAFGARTKTRTGPRKNSQEKAKQSTEKPISAQPYDEINPWYSLENTTLSAKPMIDTEYSAQQLQAYPRINPTDSEQKSTELSMIFSPEQLKTTDTTSTLKANADEDWANKLAELLPHDEDPNHRNLYARHKRAVNTSGPYRIWDHDERFAGQQDAIVRLTRPWSIFLTLLYAGLFLCAIITLYYNKINFYDRCCQKEAEQMNFE